MRDKVLKNEGSKICGRQLFKNWSDISLSKPGRPLATGKKYGKYGNFFVKNMGGLWVFQQNYGRNMVKIRVYQTKANIEGKSESTFMHLNITMF